jgi:mono/diheme cytochrome c family protein
MRLWLPALAASLLMLTGCGRAPGYPGNPPQRPDQVMSFTALYGQNCAACHGANGQNGPAMDLGNPEYQAYVDDATLRKTISNGMPGTQMPAFAQSVGGTLTDQQIEVLVAGMRKHWRTGNGLEGTSLPSYAQSKPGDAQQGAETYKERCGICHKQGPEEITGPTYLALVSDQALRTMIVAGRPDIGQPDWRHDSLGGKETTPLSAQEIDDIVSYLDSLRRPAIPAGPVADSGSGR